MDAAPWDSPLADNHAILVHHRTSLSSEKLVSHLQSRYGRITSYVNFEMKTTSGMLTAIFFCHSEDGVSCFLDLRHIVEHSRTAAQERSPTLPGPASRSAIVNVGWIHEDSFWATFQTTPHIKVRLPSEISSSSSQSSGDDDARHLAVYWKQAIPFQRMEIEMMASAQGAKWSVDNKQGGRLKLHFRCEAEAVTFRDRVVSRYPFLSRFIVFEEPEDG